MIKANTSTAFKFTKFRVSKFSYEETGKENNDYNIEIRPSGIYNETNGEYQLILKFKAFDKENVEKAIIKVTAIAEFKFDSLLKFEELPLHFFNNSVPILFPYLRSFVSTLTMQANANILMLGLIKFDNISEPLKLNTIVINN